MHALEVIIGRNAAAAGREFGHAVLDGTSVESGWATAGLAEDTPDTAALAAFVGGYERGLREGLGLAA